jgi:hypothetical protein
MIPIAQMRKAFLKKGLIPTVLRYPSTDKQKKSRKSGSQGKTGRKIRPVRQPAKMSETRNSGCVINDLGCLIYG